MMHKLPFTTEVKGFISWFLTNIALPCAILNSFETPYSIEIIVLIGKSFAVSLIVILLTMLFALFYTFLFNKKGISRRLWMGCFTFSNILFIGMPIVSELFGAKGLIVLVVYNTVANLFLFTVGIMIFSGQKQIEWRKMIQTPALIAACMGFLFFVLNIRFPTPIKNFIEVIGTMTVPLAMILNGALFASVSLKTIIKNKDNLQFSFLRLLILPLCMIPLLKLGIQDSLILGVMVLVSGMPTGALNAVFAEQYAQKGAKVSQYIAISTIISLVTLPLLLFFV